MSNLWVYGDSFSMDMNLDSAPPFVQYRDYKKRYLNCYGDFIAKELNLNLINRAIGGIDNFTILENICKDIENIKEGDLVVIGWGSQTRFRIVYDITNDWVPVSNHTDSFEPNLDNISIQKILINRLHELYRLEIENWNKLIKKSLINNFVYTWTWYNMGFTNQFQNIKEETNGIIDDGHWSENGHEDFANYVLKFYNEWKDKQ
jgi:hypothetical protein